MWTVGVTGMFGAYCAEKLYRDSARLGLRILVLDAGAFLFPGHIQNLPPTRRRDALTTRTQAPRLKGRGGVDQRRVDAEPFRSHAHGPWTYSRISRSLPFSRPSPVPCQILPMSGVSAMSSVHGPPASTFSNWPSENTK
jgi:hypothetical protein